MGNETWVFQFAAAFFEAESELSYRCFMVGYDEKWSDWNKKTTINYTNLDAGTYTFRVQAKNIYDLEGEEDRFMFTVLPPWYKTWLAYLLYVVSILLFFFLVLKWRSTKLLQEKKKLETVVIERTQEVQQKNRQLENQTRLLTAQSEKLQEMDRIKSRFFANISHEFRTPLTLIMSPLEKMSAQSSDESGQQTVGLMMRNARQLLRLINQLLDLSRFDSGKMKLNAAYLDIVPFLKAIVSQFEIPAQSKNIALKFSAPENDLFLYFDAARLGEAVCNLLINALKFTNPGGSIQVSVQRETPQTGSSMPGHVTLSVKDSGIGISLEQMPRIFDRFYQAEHHDAVERKGTGIGLAITREIVELHQGTINVHSYEGEGSEFAIRLPLGNQHLERKKSQQQVMSGCLRLKE